MGAIDLDRRTFLLTGCAMAVLPVTPIFAATPRDAEKLIARLTKDINKSIESRTSDAELYVQFEAIFRKYADVSTMSRYALGADARGATKKQLSAFGDVFVTYIARKYGAYFKDFIGGEITVIGSRAVKKYIEVKTTTKLRGQNRWKCCSMFRTDRDHCCCSIFMSRAFRCYSLNVTRLDQC